MGDWEEPCDWLEPPIDEAGQDCQEGASEFAVVAAPAVAPLVAGKRRGRPKGTFGSSEVRLALKDAEDGLIQERISASAVVVRPLPSMRSSATTAIVAAGVGGNLIGASLAKFFSWVSRDERFDDSIPGLIDQECRELM
jgi:hypothetical protein